MTHRPHHFLWKMNKYKQYIGSERFEQIKEAMVRRYGYKCMKCSSTRNIQLHHKNYDFSLGMERFEDLLLVCDKCHKSLHN